MFAGLAVTELTTRLPPIVGNSDERQNTSSNKNLIMLCWQKFAKNFSLWDFFFIGRPYFSWFILSRVMSFAQGNQKLNICACCKMLFFTVFLLESKFFVNSLFSELVLDMFLQRGGLRLPATF